MKVQHRVYLLPTTNIVKGKVMFSLVCVILFMGSTDHYPCDTPSPPDQESPDPTPPDHKPPDPSPL